MVPFLSSSPLKPEKRGPCPFITGETEAYMGGRLSCLNPKSSPWPTSQWVWGRGTHRPLPPVGVTLTEALHWVCGDYLAGPLGAEVVTGDVLTVASAEHQLIPVFLLLRFQNLMSDSLGGPTLELVGMGVAPRCAGPPLGSLPRLPGWGPRQLGARTSQPPLPFPEMGGIGALLQLHQRRG